MSANYTFWVMISQRKENILSAIIEEHIKTAGPVGSKFIVDLRNISVSPATVRNEMAELEKLGFIAQPHTSAGRIPTEKGYQYYIDHHLIDAVPNKKDKELLKRLFSKNFHDAGAIKSLAKGVSEITQEAVLVGFSKNSFYYTGISHLFSQPEFYNYAHVCRVSEVIDKFDEIMSEIFDDISDDIKIFVGKKSPFHGQCSSIFIRCRISETSRGIFGIFGPLRMDYNRNYNLIKFLKSLIDNE